MSNVNFSMTRLTSGELGVVAEVALIPWSAVGVPYDQATPQTVHNYMLRSREVDLEDRGYVRPDTDTASDQVRNHLAGLLGLVRQQAMTPTSLSIASFESLEPLEQDFVDEVAHSEFFAVEGPTVIRGGLAGLVSRTTGDAIDASKVTRDPLLPGMAEVIWVGRSSGTIEAVGALATVDGLLALSLRPADEPGAPAPSSSAEAAATSSGPAVTPPGSPRSPNSPPPDSGDGEFSELIDFVMRACTRLKYVASELQESESVSEEVRSTMGPVESAIQRRQEMVIEGIRSGRYDATLRAHGLSNGSGEWQFKRATYDDEERHFDAETNESDAGRPIGSADEPEESADEPEESADEPEESADKPEKRRRRRLKFWRRGSWLLKKANVIFRSLANSLVPGARPLTEIKDAIEGIVEVQADEIPE